jgi:hypothetical protein
MANAARAAAWYAGAAMKRTTRSSRCCSASVSSASGRSLSRVRSAITGRLSTPILGPVTFRSRYGVQKMRDRRRRCAAELARASGARGGVRWPKRRSSRRAQVILFCATAYIDHAPSEFWRRRCRSWKFAASNAIRPRTMYSQLPNLWRSMPSSAAGSPPLARWCQRRYQRPRHGGVGPN